MIHCMSEDINNLQKILKTQPDNFQARRQLAMILLEEGFNEEAITNLKFLLKTFPENHEMWFNLGIAYEKIKQKEKAVEAYRHAVSLSAQEDYCYNLGSVLLELKNYNDAIEEFLKVNQTSPNDENTIFNIGLCYFNLKEYNKALDYFLIAIEQDPDDVYAYFYTGYIYKEQGLTNFAIENYKKVIDIDPNYSWAYFNLGSIAYENGNLNEATEYLKKTLTYNPADAGAYRILAKIHVSQSQLDKALTTLIEGLSKTQNNGDICYELSCLFKLMGDEDNRQNYIKLALENKLSLTYPIDQLQRECKV